MEEVRLDTFLSRLWRPNTVMAVTGSVRIGLSGRVVAWYGLRDYNSHIQFRMVESSNRSTSRKVADRRHWSYGCDSSNPRHKGSKGSNTPVDERKYHCENVLR